MIIDKNESTSWVDRCAGLERQRRKETANFRQLAESLRSELSQQISVDLQMYMQQFPEERKYIERKQEPGCSRISKIGHPDGLYDGPKPSVKISFQTHPDLMLECSFEHRSSLNRSFKVVLRENGHPCFEGASIPELSEYVLKPILFDNLEF